MTNTKELCPDCQVGHLSEETYSEEIRYRDQLLQVDGLRYWSCEHCGAEIIRADQIRDGDRLIAEAKREADGLLSGPEIRALRKRLGLSQHEAAEIFGGWQNAFSKYERGDVIQSRGMDNSIRLAALDRKNLDYLKQRAGWERDETDSNRTVTHKRTTVVPFPRPAVSVADYQDGSETDWYTERKQG